MSWHNARLAEFNAMRAEGMFRAEITVGDTAYIGISTPAEIERGMTRSAYQPERTVQFSLLASDWTASNLDCRKTFEHGGSNYEVLSFTKDEEIDPVISFRASLKK